MDLKGIVKNIDKKSFKAVYFLHGDEPHFIEVLEKYFIKNTLSEEDKDFNQHVVYAKDTELEQVLKLAKQFPMMAERQLIVVREAQTYKTLDLLINYLKSPLEQTVLVISYKGKKLDSRIEAKLKGDIEFFYSQKLYENKIPDFINNLVEEKGLKIAPKAALLLCEYLGNDLAKIYNEIGKLEIILPPGGLISLEVIEQNIGISKEFNSFELVNAIANKNIFKATQIAIHFSKNVKNNPLVVTTGNLYNFFSKILLMHFSQSSAPADLARLIKVNAFFFKDYQRAQINYNRKDVAEILHLILEYDLKSKGLGSSTEDEGELTKELIFRILAVG